MRRIAKQMMCKMAPLELIPFREKLVAMVAATGDALLIGSACSGSDVTNHALQCLIDEWSTMFGIVLKVRHVFSCEIVDWKRDFLEEHWSPEHMFTDVSFLGKETTQDADGDMQYVPWCHVFHFGFECDSVSGLNCHTSRFALRPYTRQPVHKPWP